MAQAVLGIAFLIFGGVSIWDARRIASTTRLRGTLDIVGPDGYSLGVGVLLLAIGVLLTLKGFADARHRGARVAPSAADETGSYSHFALIAVLLVYAIAMPVVGYAVTTLAFFLAVFRIMGIRSWVRNAVASLGLTVLFYLAFTIVADLPLPKGWHGLG